jgi:hypothetical protein
MLIGRASADRHVAAGCRASRIGIANAPTLLANKLGNELRAVQVRIKELIPSHYAWMLRAAGAIRSTKA